MLHMLSQLEYTRMLTALENLEISGNLSIRENSGNLKFTQGVYQMLFFHDCVAV